MAQPGDNQESKVIGRGFGEMDSVDYFLQGLSQVPPTC